MIIIFSQYMRHLYIPLGTYKWRIFELFPVLLGIVTVWIYGARPLLGRYCKLQVSSANG